MGVFLFVSLLTINFCILACTRSTHLIRCFWCTWSMFLNKHFLSGLFLWQVYSLLYLSYLFVFVFFWPLLVLVFLTSFSLYCFTVFVALFLSFLGLSPQAILSISISSSSGTFCLCILAFVLGFIYSLRAKCLSVFALSFSSCLSFCPHILYAVIFVLAKSR